MRFRPTRLLPLTLVLLTSLASAEAPDATTPRPVAVEDLLALAAIGDPQVSPDGRWVAYTVRSNDLEEDETRTRIWMVPTGGGEAIPMTSETGSASQPRWSPDDRFLSFKAARGGKDGKAGKAQVWSLNRVGGEARQVTKVKQGIESYAWSPDGSRLLLVIRDPEPAELTDDKEDDDKPRPHVIDRIQFKQDYAGYLDRRRTHLYLLALGDDEPAQLTSGDFDDEDPVWSPDGRFIAFVSDRSDEPDLAYGTDIWIVAADPDDPQLTRVTAHPGRDFAPTWSEDGTELAYVTSTGPDIGGSALTPTKHLAITRVGEDERRLLTGELDRNVARPRFGADGSAIYFVLEDEGREHLAAVARGGGPIQRPVDGPVTVRDFALEGDRLVALVETSDHPAELFAVVDGGLAQLTEVNAAALHDVARAPMEKRAFASADGTTVEAFFVRPLGYREGERYATILWLHGGPAAQFSYGFSEVAQLFAANGYAVIMPNPRGSTGYGEAFAKATVAAWGERDVADVLAAVDHGIEIGLVDPDRLGVGGWSYGGILTNYVITQTDRFAAAMSGASLGLVTANYGHDQYQLMYELEFGLPWEEPERWTRLSPFSRVEAITTPTLWMGGAVDWNVPIINSEQMYLAMKRLGRDTLLVVYPDEHHGIRRPSFVADRYERWLAWFGRHLAPASDDGS